MTVIITETVTTDSTSESTSIVANQQVSQSAGAADLKIQGIVGIDPVNPIFQDAIRDVAEAFLKNDDGINFNRSPDGLTLTIPDGTGSNSFAAITGNHTDNLSLAAGMNLKANLAGASFSTVIHAQTPLASAAGTEVATMEALVLKVGTQQRVNTNGFIKFTVTGVDLTANAIEAQAAISGLGLDEAITVQPSFVANGTYDPVDHWEATPWDATFNIPSLNTLRVRLVMRNPAHQFANSEYDIRFTRR